MRKGVIITIVVAAIVVAGGIVALAVNTPSNNNSNHSSKNSAPASNSSNAPPVNNAVLITKTASNVGQYLADPSGRPLYTFGGDTKGVSNCTGKCLEEWPAYTAAGSTASLPADVGVIKRSDNGQMQYTYQGMPLYFFAHDSNGQVTGNKVDNFVVARPAASSSSSGSSSGTNSPGAGY